MKKLILTGLGILGLLSLVLVLFKSPPVGQVNATFEKPQEQRCEWSEWEDTSSCTTNQCGTQEGTKSQERVCTTEECEYSCPVIHFEWTKEYCPDGYFDWQNTCAKWNGRGWDYTDKIVDNKSADVQYEKSQDPNKCHRPSDNDLKDEYGMDHDARKTFKKQNSEWKDAKKSCEEVVVDTETRDDVACRIPEEDVIACGTIRWCFPSKDEEHPYYAEAIPDNEEPETGMAWETGMDKYCEFPEDEPEEPSDEPKEESHEEHHEDHHSEPSAPQCGYTAPTKVGANFHIYRKGGEVIAKWYPTEGNKAHIYYKENSASDWQHALRDVENDGYETINVDGKDYTFALQQANECAGGPLTSPVVDGDTTGWVLFR